MRRANEESVLEKVERDRKSVKADLGIPRGREIRVTITDCRRDLRHLDDDLMPRQRRNPHVERIHHRRELLPRDAVIEIFVQLLHLARREMEVVLPRSGAQKEKGRGQSDQTLAHILNTFLTRMG